MHGLALGFSSSGLDTDNTLRHTLGGLDLLAALEECLATEVLLHGANIQSLTTNSEILAILAMRSSPLLRKLILNLENWATPTLKS